MNLETLKRTQSSSIYRIHQNVMEALVEREVELQLKHLPQHLSRYLDPIDIATYALNRLPPLYASTEKGKSYQELIGQSKFKPQITTVVRQAIMAIQRDPIRQLTPLTAKGHTEISKAKKALNELQNWLLTHHLLGLDAVTWDNLLQVFRKSFRKVLKPHITAMERLQSLLIEKHQMALTEDITYENLVEVVEKALIEAEVRKTTGKNSSQS